MSQPTKPKGARVIGAPKNDVVNPETSTSQQLNGNERDNIFSSPTPNVSRLLASPSEITTPDITHSDSTPIVSATPSLLESPSPSPRMGLKESENISIGGIICPICNDQMVSLLQLNRHLDDEHLFNDRGSSYLPSPSPPLTEELSSWVKKTNDVKSKLQTALPRKLVKLDIFDNNTTFGISDSSSRDSSTNSLNTLANPEITVTRKHWQKPRGHEKCSYKGCNKQLSIKNGIVNCRKCGQLYCHEHTSFRVRLDSEAHYDASGAWCRCCESCYFGKPGYNDCGLFNDLTEKFKLKRQTKINERQLYENKLEKRLINLATKFSKIDREFKSNEFNSNFLNFKINSRKREAEQQLVQWEDEKFVLNCFICLRNYSFTLRKHHCRLCGRVVCGSDDTACSKEIPINVLTGLLDDLPKINDNSLVRMCRNCKDVLFSKRNFIKDLKSELSPLLSKFETQQNVKKTILILMPKFQSLIEKLQSDKNLTNQSIILEASKQRKRLTDAFGLFDKLTKEIIALDCELDDEKRLQLSIQTESASFIKRNMGPLKQLPRILKQIEEEAKKAQPPRITNSEIAAIKAKREELMVLNEQKFLVDQMIETCKKQRKFDEIPPLTENLNEITSKIGKLQLSLGNDGF